MARKRLEPKVRKEQIMSAALSVAERKGYTQMERADIARAAGVSEALVSCYFGTMPQVRRAVMRHAVQVEHLRVIAQGIVINDRHALRASEDVRRAALQSITG